MSEVVELDASAGGQVFRYGIGLSALLGKPVKISNIRRQASNPGLQHQHLTSLNALARVCGAGVRGARLHSLTVEFVPKKVKPSVLAVNIGTAGSCTLLLQSLLLPSMLEQEKITVIGGTDVPCAPSYYYFEQVLFPFLKKMGVFLECSLTAHGFFPKGNGKICFSSKKSRFPLKPIFFDEQGKLERVKIFSQSASLPKSVSLTQAKVARKELEGLDVDIVEKIYFREKSDTIGSSIDLVAFFGSGTAIGVNALGAKAKPAEDVGKEAAKKLVGETSTGKPIDQHLADQLIPFMALAEGYSTIHVTRLTEHCLSSISIAEKFLGVKFEVKGKLNEQAEISVEGAGWKPKS